MKLIETSVKRPVGVIMIILAVVALGVVSLRNLAVDLFPEINLPVAVVATSYPGAAPQEVENLISRPIEQAVATVEGIDTVSSQSMAGSSLVLMMFKSGVDMDNTILEVREKVDMIKGQLPSDANDPNVMRFDPQAIPVIFVGLKGADLAKLEQIAENDIEPALESTEGVASVTTEGGQTREIQVEVNQARLAQFGLTQSQIAQALAAENMSNSAGTLDKGDKDIQIRIDGQFTSIEDIENTLVPLPTGGHVKVRDIAVVKDTYKEMAVHSEIDGEPALVMLIMKQSDANTVAVADNVIREVDRLQAKLPEGVELSVVYDTSVFIRDSIDSVVNNMLLGGIFASLVLLLFLRSVRATLVIVISIPIALIATFALLYFTGQTINTVTMGGLALGLGMVVDSSIVILENIYVFRQRGASIFEAAVKGASQLASAVIASTTTTVVVFVPIVFLEGMSADLFTPMALAVSFSLFASLIVGLTLVPMLSSKMLINVHISIGEEGDVVKGIVPRLLQRINRVYRRMLDWVLRHRKTTVLATLIAFFGSFAALPMLGFELMPSADQGEIQIDVTTPSGTTLSETRKVANQIYENIQEYKDIIEMTYVSVGGSGGGLATASNSAQFQVLLVPKNERELTTQEVLEKFNESIEDIPGAEIRVSEISHGLGTGSPIQIKINGPDSDVLNELADQIVYLISQVEGVYNPETSTSESQPELNVIIDRQVASQYGLNYMQIMNQIQSRFTGEVATVYREEGNEFDVTVVFPKDESTTIEHIENMFIQTPTGANVPLSTVAKLEQKQGPTLITRENQQRQVNVTSDILGSDLNTVTMGIQAKLASIQMPEGYSYSFGGDAEEMVETFTNLAIALLFSIFLVYAVMAVQFESFSQPLVIMFSVPTLFIGAILGLLVTNVAFGVTAFIGIILLAGIVLNNAIVLVDYINILRREGKDRHLAITMAGPARLRPILMTTVTTVLAMLPLAIGFGTGAETQQPMAIVIVFGLTTSTLFTLFFVPVMYTYIDDISNWLTSKNKFKRFRFRRRKKKDEETPVES